jgi:hypothetical protein
MPNPHIEGRRQRMLVLRGSKKDRVDIWKVLYRGRVPWGTLQAREEGGA